MCRCHMICSIVPIWNNGRIPGANCSNVPNWKNGRIPGTTHITNLLPHMPCDCRLRHRPLQHGAGRAALSSCFFDRMGHKLVKGCLCTKAAVSDPPSCPVGTGTLNKTPMPSWPSWVPCRAGRTGRPRRPCRWSSRPGCLPSPRGQGGERPRPCRAGRRRWRSGRR